MSEPMRGSIPLVGNNARHTRITNGKPQIIVEEPGDHLSVNLGLTIVKEPVRGLSLLLCPCVLSEFRLFPQIYFLLLVTLVAIILGFYPR